MPVLRTKTSRMWLPDALRGLALLVYMLHQPVIYGVLWVWHTVLG